ncbi:MAG: hypothetical protein HY064_05645 [Bacteroidetes bacterium]|nr:hypothetical protein [Bacteroidota bacterium]
MRILFSVVTLFIKLDALSQTDYTIGISGGLPFDRNLKLSHLETNTETIQKGVNLPYVLELSGDAFIHQKFTAGFVIKYNQCNYVVNSEIMDTTYPSNGWNLRGYGVHMKYQQFGEQLRFGENFRIRKSELGVNVNAIAGCDEFFLINKIVTTGYASNYNLAIGKPNNPVVAEVGAGLSLIDLIRKRIFSISADLEYIYFLGSLNVVNVNTIVVLYNNSTASCYTFFSPRLSYFQIRIRCNIFCFSSGTSESDRSNY